MSLVRRVGAFGALVLGVCGASACSLFVSTDGLENGTATNTDAGEDATDGAGRDAIGDDDQDASPAVDAAEAAAKALPKFRAFSSTDNTVAGNTMVVTRSPQIVEGDLIIAIVYEFSINTTSTPPTGWSTGARIDGVVGSYEVFSYYRFATASEPSTYTFAINTTGYGEVDLLAYSGVDQTTPFDSVKMMTFGSTSQLVLPQLTTTEQNELIFIAGVADGQTSDVWTAPIGVTSEKNTGYTFYGDEPQLTSGETANQTLVSSVSDTNGCVLVAAIRPM